MWIPFALIEAVAVLVFFNKKSDFLAGVKSLSPKEKAAYDTAKLRNTTAAVIALTGLFVLTGVYFAEKNLIVTLLFAALCVALLVVFASQIGTNKWFKKEKTHKKKHKR
ncbi:MAG: DUF3784 domain-containing protein [Oscillospiraceae bacterium]|jgi:uncharacterized membrane protein|nr:DUF3784 domain-containing protein [Oscillospiraceae bacterium]